MSKSVSSILAPIFGLAVAAFVVEAVAREIEYRASLGSLRHQLRRTVQGV